jgi:hypothetical protein
MLILADATAATPNLSDPTTYLVQLPIAAFVTVIFVVFVVRPMAKAQAQADADRKAEAVAAATALKDANAANAAALLAAASEVRRLNEERAQRDRDLLVQVMSPLQRSMSALQATSQGLESLKQGTPTTDELTQQLKVLAEQVRELRAVRDGKP